MRQRSRLISLPTEGCKGHNVAIKTSIKNVRPAGVGHQVVTVATTGRKGNKIYRKSPCATCPWRTDAVGVFPPEAFRHSAPTAYDMAQETFACHSSGIAKPAICAGFLLKGAEHNMAVRIAYMGNKIQDDLSDKDINLFDSYRDMAVANGVDPDDPVLKNCRD